MDRYIAEIVKNPLFYGIDNADMKAMLGCMQAFVKPYKKGQYIIFEEDDVTNIGIILSGNIDMIKEDIWGNKTTLVRMGERELFGETFTCGSDSNSVVTFYTSTDALILFIPFERVMHVCSMKCIFHHRMIENMVSMIAAKNRQLMEKVEVVSKKTLREKILAYLSQQAQEKCSRCFEVPLGRLEMADYLCTDRSALTRELSKMRDEGIIDYNKNVFKLL